MDNDSPTRTEQEPEFARPWARHRLRIYVATAGFTAFVFVAMTVGVGLGLIAPTLTADIVANLLFGIPVILLPLVLLWDAPGEQRSRLDRAAELTLFWLPYSAASQIGYELVFLIGHPLGLWEPTSDPGWKWLWWQYGLADTRYTSGNPWTFALEVVGVVTGITVFIVWTRLIRPGLPLESRIRCLWLAFTGVAVIYSSTAVYFLAEVGSGFDDIGQGPFGLWFKFIGENLPFIVLPPFVLYAIHLQVDFLTRRAGVPTAVSTQSRPA
ncbi:emopamil-binding protein [Mycolicibacterium chubuense]|uniref:Emopamil binding protein n=1 Tax=Mycolicibacterium chubuense TaxID=1800 RepID=A0A0J6WBN6_MYCCU|nr:Emopamil binding protein [Mycolicibacterium chubuense]KMO80620.1 Emopamil binding protein [Mycolicibacterium chubuense]ORA52168.1 emopamil-binding protein [Mycolicibacterium chubuense]SPY45322.1 Emopamil binding protein [Mycolicibacterium chubuense]